MPASWREEVDLELWGLFEGQRLGGRGRHQIVDWERKDGLGKRKGRNVEREREREGGGGGGE